MDTAKIISAYAKDRDKRGIRDFTLTKSVIRDLLAYAESVPAAERIGGIRGKTKEILGGEQRILKRVNAADKSIEAIIPVGDENAALPDDEIVRLLAIAYPAKE